eukprot:1017732-Heterocapsa_arctica.AAC.1
MEFDMHKAAAGTTGNTEAVTALSALKVILPIFTAPEASELLQECLEKLQVWEQSLSGNLLAAALDGFSTDKGLDQ